MPRAELRQGAMMTSRDLPPGLPQFFSVRSARERGMARRRLDAPGLDSAFHGSRSVRSLEPAAGTFVALRRDHVRRCREFMAIARPGAYFSHVTAAVIYGMPLPSALARRLEIDVSSSSQPPRRAGVIGHRGSATDVRQVGGLPVVSPERAWLQLATALDLPHLVAAGDYLVRLKNPLSTVDALRGIVLASGGLRGAAAARDAFTSIRPGTASPKESELRLLILAGGLPEPVVGYTVHHEGYWVGTPDLAYVAERIAIEYQGEGHREEAVYDDDIDRLERFRDAGWLVIQVTKTHLRDPHRLVKRIAWHLAARAQK